MSVTGKWQKRVTLGFLALILVSLIIMMSGGLTAKGAWAVAMIALLAAVGTFYLGSSLQRWELNNHVLDISAHPGGIEAINQDLVKMGNLLTEQREILRQIPELRARVDRLEAWESDLSKVAQVIGQIQEIKKTLSDLSIATASRCEGLAASIRELHAKVTELESLRQSTGQMQQLDHSIQQLKQTVDHLSGLPGQLASVAERVASLASLAQEVSALKEELESIQNVPDDIGKLAEHHRSHEETLSRELASLSEEIEALKAAVDKFSPLSGEFQALAGEVKKFQQASGRLADIEALKKQVEELCKTVTALQARPAAASAGGVSTGSGADTASILSELAELKKTVAQLQAEQPNLDINIKEAKLVSQQDRTVIMCTLTVRNLSNKPNEITAVRAELDSGRDRMAPTSIRHWLPDGKQTNEERLILLPQKILESSTTGPITLTAIGWPLEKVQESYAFRITLRDKNGNEFVKNHRLVPEPAGA